MIFLSTRKDMREKRSNAREKYFRDTRFTMEHWLLHTQSATYNGSLTGHSLFSRCFGCEKEAFDAYRMYLHSCFPEGLESVWHTLFSFEDKHELDRYYREDDVPPDHQQKLAQGVADAVWEMLRRDGQAYDQLKIYMRRDNYFLQIRFLFYGENGWQSDDELIVNPGNHDLLISMHAHGRNADEAVLKQYGFDVFDTRTSPGEGRNGQWLHWMDLPYELSFATDYARWKSDIIQ